MVVRVGQLRDDLHEAVTGGAERLDDPVTARSRCFDLTSSGPASLGEVLQHLASEVARLLDHRTSLGAGAFHLGSSHLPGVVAELDAVGPSSVQLDLCRLADPGRDRLRFCAPLVEHGLRRSDQTVVLGGCFRPHPVCVVLRLGSGRLRRHRGLVAEPAGFVTKRRRLVGHGLRSRRRRSVALRQQPLGVLRGLRADLRCRLACRGDDASGLLSQDARDPALVQFLGLLETTFQVGETLGQTVITFTPRAERVCRPAQQRPHLGGFEPLAGTRERRRGERARVQIRRCGREVGGTVGHGRMLWARRRVMADGGRSHVVSLPWRVPRGGGPRRPRRAWRPAPAARRRRRPPSSAGPTSRPSTPGRGTSSPRHV